MRNKSVLILVGLLAFIAIVGGISYSYFVYNKKLGDISINTGEIAINYSGVNGNLSLSNVIPMSDNDGMTTSSYIDFTVDATVDTDKIYYELYIMPKSGNTLNTDYLKTYLTNQQNVKISEVTLYKDLSNSEKSGGKTIYKGLVNINNDGSKKTYSKAFRLRLWLDDTYQETASKTFEFDIYLHAYNVQNVKAKNISYNGEDCSNVQCELEALAGVEIQKPLCKRATTLHSETCENQRTNFCQGAGYALNGNIEYGNLGTSGELHTGDAFDCDVNGDGTYNPTTERFYYVSSYYDTNTKTFDNDTAVLIYYANFVNGSPTDDIVDYATQTDIQAAGYTCSDEKGCNWYGPVSAVKHLPTTSTWSNVELKTTSRKIISCDAYDCVSLVETTKDYDSDVYHTIENPFSYAGKAARLLTIMELKHAGCDTSSTQLGGCKFLFEKTIYADPNSEVYGIWLENPISQYQQSVFCAAPARENLFGGTVGDSTYSSSSVRPVIDVPMDRMKY